MCSQSHDCTLGKLTMINSWLKGWMVVMKWQLAYSVTLTLHQGSAAQMCSNSRVKQGRAA